MTDSYSYNGHEVVTYLKDMMFQTNPKIMSIRRDMSFRIKVFIDGYHTTLFSKNSVMSH